LQCGSIARVRRKESASEVIEGFHNVSKNAIA